MARYDKYEPKSGGFRAALAADHAATAVGTGGNPIAVGLNASGQVVDGLGNSGIVGILVTTRAMKAGEIVDVQTDGEVVELTGMTAGTVITALDTTGVLATTAPGAGRTRIGHTVEATRLVVRVAR